MHMRIYRIRRSRRDQSTAANIRHIHINDNDLRRDLHLAVGDGRIDWELFCRYYQTYFEECSVLIETTKPDNQRRSLEYLRKKL